MRWGGCQKAFVFVTGISPRARAMWIHQLWRVRRWSWRGTQEIPRWRIQQNGVDSSVERQMKKTVPEFQRVFVCGASSPNAGRGRLRIEDQAVPNTVRGM